MMDFKAYNRVRLYTHGRALTPTEHSVGHIDDFLCMAIAAKHCWAAIRLDDVSPDHVRGRMGRDSYVLNVITDFAYEPEWWENNVIVFDHHDPATSNGLCSARLLMQELARQGLMHEVPALMDEISRWDVVGPQAVTPENRPDPDRYMSVLAAEPDEGFDRKTAEFILKMLERSFSIRQFVNELFESETRLGENARRIHSEILAKREEALAEIIGTATVSESPSGVRYATLDKNPAGLLREIFSRLGVDVVIHPNERTPNAVSVVRDSNGRYATTPVAELVEVAQEQVVFTHPGGFLLVAYPPVIVK
jgi:hypothetical protein